jgi:oligopeptide/dipeptide ABC transporter ATP-binding protein
MPEPILTVDNLAVDFPTKDGVVHAVRGVSADLAPGEVLGIVGESGSGKSVTAMATMGLLPKTARVSGSVRFNQTELLGLKEKRLMPVRGKGIAMIFQDPMTSLNPVYSVGWQIAEAIRAHNDVSKAEATRRSIELLRTVGIPYPEDRVSSYPHEFSGGMRQRVVIAIAMANDPDVILADEPTTALDVTVQAQVLDALRKALDETHAALLLITHDLGVVAGIADRVLVMYAGRAVELGTVDEIFYEPAMPYTIGLLGSIPRLDEEGDKLRPIPGSPPSMAGARVGCPFAPRCPLRQPICDQEEPPLRPVGSASVAGSAGVGGAGGAGGSAQAATSAASGRSHLAACHFADQVHSGEMKPEFQALSVDTEILEIKLEPVQ